LIENEGKKKLKMVEFI